MPLKPSISLELELFIQALCTKKILSNAINAGGSSLRDYIAPNGVLGNFQNFFKVYGKENKECSYCKEPIMKKNYHQRATYFCPNCQQY